MIEAKLCVTFLVFALIFDWVLKTIENPFSADTPTITGVRSLSYLCWGLFITSLLLTVWRF